MPLIVLGVAATLLSVRSVLDDVDERESRSADLAMSELSGALEQTVAAVRGADALAADGVVDPEEFAMFARGVVTDSSYAALAFAEVVTEDERDEFVSSTGIDIVDTDGLGGFVPAPRRARSVVVVDVYPRSPTATGIIGFDIAGDDIRREATELADTSLTPVLSRRNRTAAGGEVGISVVEAVRTPQDRVVGYVTSGLAIESLLAAAGAPASSLERVGLWMDGEQLSAEAPDRGAERQFVVAGRTFTLRVDADHTPDLLLPIIVGVGTIVLAAVVAIAARRDHRQREQLARLARRNRGIADLGRQLTASTAVESVVAEVGSTAGPVLDGAQCLVVRRPSESTNELSTDHAGDVSTDVERWLLAGPVARCLASGQPDAGSSSVGNEQPVGAHLCVPLCFSGGFTAGVLAFVWPEPAPESIMDERRVAATTIAELSARALERALVAEIVRTGAERLGAFARELTAAPTTEEVVGAVAELVPGIVGATTAELRVGPVSSVPNDVEPHVLTRTIGGPDGADAAVLEVRWAADSSVGTTQHAVLVTLADLIAQTLGRTMQAQQRLDVITELQRELLADPDPVDGLDVAVGYQPALTVVGLGGDFYDVIVSDGGRVFAVIGDITGHGAHAVAVMSELKSAIHHLLRSDSALADVVAAADRLLARRGVMATAQIFELDLSAGTISYVNAGHPFPVMRRADGTVSLLLDGHRALLGLVDNDQVPTRVASTEFEAGDVLLLYTDGLVERRDEALDVAIDRLVGRVAIADADASMRELVDWLQSEFARPDVRSDDDIALLALRYVPRWADDDRR